MNRWYTRDEYINLVDKIRHQVKKAKISTDIIVGFPGETKKQYENTVDLCKRVKFYKAYLAMYSDRPLTQSHRAMKDNIPLQEKNAGGGY